MTHPAPASPPILPIASALPGIGLCAAITVAAYGIERIEAVAFGKAWLESIVLAILLGTVVRSLWKPGRKWEAGIAFSAKYFLEIAIVLLGASLTTAMIKTAGPALIVGIAAVVVLAILVSFGIGKLLRLPTRMALLIACGNSICGNSAIAAVAPVIGAECDDVAASIAFTAVLGVVVVLALPIFGLAYGLSGAGYGAFTGLTVYAVPQVIAAAAPMGAVAVQMGTMVKLVRVLMLGPVCLVLSLLAPHIAPPQFAPATHPVRPERALPRKRLSGGGDRSMVYSGVSRDGCLSICGAGARGRHRANWPSFRAAYRDFNGRARAGC